MMMSERDPHPFPTYQNDNNFIGPKGTQKPPYTQPTHLAQQTEPWNRLYNKCTLSSSRREIYHHDPQAPRDSLDFVLKSEYNHHQEFLKGQNETLIQPETLGQEHGRVLKNREIVVPPNEPEHGHPLGVCSMNKKEDINTINMNIIGNHKQATNRGFIRKPDGGFFTS